MKKYTIGRFAKEIGVTVQTLRNWDKADKMKPSHTALSGHRYYSEQQRCNYLGIQIKLENEGEYVSSRLAHERVIADFIQIAKVFERRMREEESAVIRKMIDELSKCREEDEI